MDRDKQLTRDFAVAKRVVVMLLCGVLVLAGVPSQALAEVADEMVGATTEMTESQGQDATGTAESQGQDATGTAESQGQDATRTVESQGQIPVGEIPEEQEASGEESPAADVQPSAEDAGGQPSAEGDGEGTDEGQNPSEDAPESTAVKSAKGDGNAGPTPGDETIAAVESSDSNNKLEEHSLELDLLSDGDADAIICSQAPATKTRGATLTDYQRDALIARADRAATNLEESFDISDLEIPCLDWNTAIYNAIRQACSEAINVNADLFYISGGWRTWAYSDGNYTKIGIEYNYDVSSIPSMKVDYEQAMQEALSWVPLDADDFSKAKAIHDYLVRTCDYNQDVTTMGSDDYKAAYGHDPWTAYGALVTKSPVCYGYSLAFAALMRRLGIEGYVAIQGGEANHSWNRVLLEGQWYHVDVTWDDPRTSNDQWSERARVTYFVKSDAYMVEMSKSSEKNVHATWDPQGEPALDTTYDGWDIGSWPDYYGSWEGPEPTGYTLPGTLDMQTDSHAIIALSNVVPENAFTGNAVWTSSKPEVAMVNNNGQVTSGSKGGITIVACDLNGIRHTCLVRVRGGDLADGSYSVTLAQSSYTYDGGQKKPQVSAVSYKSSEGTFSLRAGTDYGVSYANNVNVGTATVVITAKGAYRGNLRKSFSIKARSLAGASIASIANKTYTGAAIKPVPTVKLDGKTLSSGKDFTLAYASNKNVGTGTVTVTGKGNYTGSVKKTFKIVAKSLEKASVAVKTQAYTGKAVKPSPTVKLSGVTLKKGTDYTLSYTNNVKAGTAKVTVKGKGNYKGTVATKFKIAANNVTYRAYVQKMGWNAWKKGGATAGTTGKSLRVEGFQAKLTNSAFAGSITYRSFVRGDGWQRGWKKNGALSGTTKRSKAIDAVQIKLTGDVSACYDVWYRAYVQKLGWLGWAKNGASAGTSGYSYRIEAVQVRLVTKGGKAPGSTKGAFKLKAGGGGSAGKIANEVEPNDYVNSPNSLALGVDCYGKLSTDNKDYFDITVNKAGKYRFTLGNEKAVAGCKIILEPYDTYLNRLGWVWPSTAATGESSTTLRLGKGTYHVWVRVYEGSLTNHPYHLRVNAV